MGLAQCGSDWHMSELGVSNNPHAERSVRMTPSECLEVPETAPTRRADKEELQARASTLGQRTTTGRGQFLQGARHLFVPVPVAAQR